MTSLYQENDTDQGLFAIKGLASSYSEHHDCVVYIYRAKWKVAKNRPVLRVNKEDDVPGKTEFQDILLKYENGRLVWGRTNIH